MTPSSLESLAKLGSSAQLPGLRRLLAGFFKDDKLSLLTKFHFLCSHLQHYYEKSFQNRILLLSVEYDDFDSLLLVKVTRKRPGNINVRQIFSSYRDILAHL